MGHLAALDMAAHADLEAALGWHLQTNHYPPVPLTMVGPCRDAITAWQDGKSDRWIPLPDGITWRGETSAPAHEVIEQHHLDPWL